MTPAEFPIRVATHEDWDEDIARLIYAAFHSPLDPQALALEREFVEPARALVATDEGTIVGHAGILTRDLSVPGAVLPAAHVTQVAVAPTHRRRGILTGLMHRQLRELHQAGDEPIAVLWASEARIYTRFGYGMAAARLSFTADTREALLPKPTPAGARIRAGQPAALQPRMARVFDRVRRQRPGWSDRKKNWWGWVLGDTGWHRGGGTELRAVVRENPTGEPDGYAVWRVKSGGEGRMAAEVHVIEVVAETAEAHLELWQFLFGIDLTRTVRYSFAAVDDPLLYLASDPGWLGARWEDSLWVRVVDLPAALTARRYQRPVEVVLEVTDPLLSANAGRWRLTAEAEKVTCEPTDAPADLALDILELGSAYLGGTPLAALAAAGRVTELRPGSLLPASTAFGWHQAPVGLGIF